MTPLLELLDTRIKAALSDMMTMSGGALKGIETEAFGGSPQDIGVLLERFKTRMPSAFLNIPTLSFEAPTGNAITDVVCNYALLIAYPDKRTTPDRRALHFARFEEVAERLLRRVVSKSGMNTTNRLDYLRFGSWAFEDTEELAVQLLTFSIRVRNWNPNSPADVA